MPEGEDPDSQCRKLGPQGFRNYLELEVKDFLQFKTEVLLQENADDPVVRAQAIHEIATSLACIADPILRSTYTTHTASLLKVEEQTLISEVNKQRLNRQKKLSQADQVAIDNLSPEPQPAALQQKPAFNDYQQEADIIRVLMLYGKEMMPETQQLVVDFVTSELNEISWDQPVLERIFQLYLEGWTKYQSLPETHELLNHPDKELANAAATIYGKHYEISKNWLKHDIYITELHENVERDVHSAVDRINLKKVHGLLDQTRLRLKELNNMTEADQNALLQEYWDLENIKIQLAARLGTIITR
jgi:DNA primase